MRIVQIIQKPQLRGAEVFASQLSEHLTSLGHEILMISLFEGYAKLPFNGEWVHLDRPAANRLYDVTGWRKLAKVLTAFNPDVVQSNAADTLKFAVLSKVWCRWRYPVVYRNANKVSDFANTLPRKLFNRLLVSATSLVISVSESCRLDLINTYHTNPSKTTTIPIGIETVTTVKPFRHSGKQWRTLIHVGSLVPEKNHLALIRIFKGLIDQGEDLKLVLIGDGPLRPKVLSMIQEAGLMNKVEWLGYRPDALSCIAGSDLLLLPSLIEGLPGVILEAMFCRIPVVAYDVGGIAEVVTTGSTGWLVSAGDEESFIKTVREVLHLLPERLHPVTESAFTLVNDKYANQKVAQRFADAYLKLSASHPRSLAQ